MSNQVAREAHGNQTLSMSDRRMLAIDASGSQAVAVEQPSTLDVSMTREALVPGRIGDVFDFVAAEDVLPKVLTGYGLVSAVASTSHVSGPWDTPGSTRTVHLADGSTAHEGVTHYDRPSYFAYRVSDPSFSLKHLMSYARGEWWFVAVGDNTQVTWKYTFRARNRLSRVALALFVRMQWRGYMDVCMRNVVQHFKQA